MVHSFETLGKSVFNVLNLPEKIEYIPIPEYLKEKYQYFIKTSIEKLGKAGHRAPLQSLQQIVADYVCSYLDKGFKVW